MSGFDPVYLFLGFSVVLIILAGIATRSRNFKVKRALLQTVLVLAILGILVFIEMFSLFKVYKRWDLTANERYTFSTMTVNLLDSLQEPLTATAFVETDVQRKQFETLLSIAHYYNLDRVQYEFADPERDFVKASAFPQPVEAPVLFLQYQGKTERVSEFGEEAFTRALARLVKTDIRKVYLLQGHGERALERSEDKTGASLSYLQALLDDQNKQIEPFTINPRELETPSDCDVLLIAGPEVDFSTGEYAALERYLAQGGQLIVLLDNDKAPGVAEWLGRFGFVLPDDMVIEMEQGLAVTSEGIQSQITLNLAVAMNLRDLEMGRELAGKKIFAIESRSVGLAADMPQGVTGEIIADSLENSWAELHPEYDNLEAAKFDEGKEQEGPIPLAAMVRGDFAGALGVPSATDTPPGSLVVFGDSNFATDRTYGRSYGINLLSNAINFLTRDTEMISIPPKTREDAPYVRMTGARWAQLLLVSLVGVPGVLFVIGLAVYLRRRKNG